MFVLRVIGTIFKWTWYVAFMIIATAFYLLATICFLGTSLINAISLSHRSF